MISGKKIVRIVAAAATLTAHALALPLPARPQELGYSYLAIEVGGHHITNFVEDKKYQGWLKLYVVEAHSLSPASRSISKCAPTEKAQASLTREQEDAREGWISLADFMKSKPGSSGKIRFDAGDSGGMEPMFEAMTHKTIVPEADLVYYDFEKDIFIGKYKLKGIRILSLEDVRASACAMYEVTMSFRSITKE
jgi:hypothetical protein